MSSQHILDRYAFFNDGQFVYENIQPALRESFENEIRNRKDGFTKITDSLLLVAKLLPWDTKHFDLSMARIEHFYFDEPEHVPGAYYDLELWLAENNVRHISVRLNVSNTSAINFLAYKGFEMITAKLMLRFTASPTTLHTLNVSFLEKDAPTISHADLTAVALSNFDQNRFLLDPYLARARSIELYSKWVSNELSRHDNDCLVAVEKGEMVGFVVFEIIAFADSQRFGFINLIAVPKEHQGRGFGKALLTAATARLVKAGVSTTFANVVSTNHSSLSLFQSCQFKVYSNLVELRKYAKHEELICE